MPRSLPPLLSLTPLEGRLVPSAVAAGRGTTASPPAVVSADVQSSSSAAKPILVGANATTGEAVYSISVMPTRPPCHCAACMALARAMNPDVTAAAVGTLATTAAPAGPAAAVERAISNPASTGGTPGLAFVGQTDAADEDRPDRIVATADAPRPAKTWTDPFAIVVALDAA